MVIVNCGNCDCRTSDCPKKRYYSIKMCLWEAKPQILETISSDMMNFSVLAASPDLYALFSCFIHFCATQGIIIIRSRYKVHHNIILLCTKWNVNSINHRTSDDRR